MASYETEEFTIGGVVVGGSTFTSANTANLFDGFLNGLQGDPNEPEPDREITAVRFEVVSGVSSDQVVVRDDSGAVQSLMTFSQQPAPEPEPGGQPQPEPEPIVFNVPLAGGDGVNLGGSSDTVEAVQLQTAIVLQPDTTAQPGTAAAELGEAALKPAAAVENNPALLEVFKEVQQGLVDSSVQLSTEEKQKVQNLVSQALEAFDKISSASGGAPLSSQQIAQVSAISSALTKAVSDIPDGVNIADVATKFITLSSPAKTGVIPLLDGDGINQVFAALDSGDSFQGVDSLVGANEILLDASASTKYDLFALNLAFVQGNTVVLKAVDAAVLAGPGSIRVDGDVPINVTSDNQAHNVTGGGGNDTLVGTGNDTLTGGGGKDLFGFAAPGKYTITDFNKAADSFQFDLKGITNVDQLKAAVTSVAVSKGAITYNFGPDTSITLVGVSPGSITADMLSFKIVG